MKQQSVRCRQSKSSDPRGSHLGPGQRLKTRQHHMFLPRFDVIRGCSVVVTKTVRSRKNRLWSENKNRVLCNGR